jgi:hypothetical protein
MGPFLKICFKIFCAEGEILLEKEEECLPCNHKKKKRETSLQVNSDVYKYNKTGFTSAAIVDSLARCH